jgi:transposase-like protein
MARSILNLPFFRDEAAAFAKLESIVWANGIVCPKCGTVGRARALEGVKDKKGRVRYGLKKCYSCRAQFTVRVGTVFEKSHVPLHLWLQAAYLMASSKKGVSSNQLHRTLGVTLKTAWFMSHRLREAMRSGSLAPMGGLGSIVEADETYIGNKKDRKKMAGNGHKHAVLTLVERGGAARSFHIERTTIANVVPIVRANIAKESELATDEGPHYLKVGQEFAGHLSVNHSEEEYVRNDAHVNTAEGYFSIFKRGMKGIYQHCGERHLHRYLAEFRYSNRIKLGIDDAERTDRALSGIVGKRLTYRDSPWA